ncbi:glycosyltransferase family 2 protein [Bradyrhizobium sp. KBS0727]|uniref:glycosyltransferase family 2 protein n=1 Tax=unclassified Bradyrhizobium TaxID=2631580 RepID=UPI00110D29B6|nr:MULTISPECIES: glycosyltransferase family 2 protein [unclassified Bradyrhizobium]QDW39508.1 glycosyltransferase family 2 protein [Bradyrhizobium sp. KBS0725]QDW46111.1 glycosyltransferase family 2 protein [Bradyrhizobium sp. KBS0727]
MNDAIRPDPESLSQAAGLPQLSVVVPTFNERDNVTVLYRRLEATLAGIPWEVVFVDDNSPDGTWEVVRGLARQDPRVRCIRRIGRRGLSGACIEGILASSAPYAAVIDADLQHDETQLPKMVGLLQRGEAELVVGSRYIEGGSADSFNKSRAGASQLATEVAKRVLKVEIADPMSGFFMIRRDKFEQLAPQLSTQGFKILLDIVATAQGKLRTIEVPFTFGSRQHGESKLDSMVALDFLGLVLAKLTHDVVSLRFLLFAMVGSIGLIVHLTTLFIALEIFNVPFPEAQAAGALVAMTSNFVLNNFLTYRDQRLKGFAILRGLLLFYLVCSVGLFANVGVAFSVYDQEPIWWLAGAAGALMGVVWNYAMSGLFVWRKR